MLSLSGRLRANLSLFGVGLALGLMHLPIALELGVTHSYQSGLVRTLVMMLYPVAMALTGLGAVIAMARPRWVRLDGFRLGGLALLVLLFASLRINFLTENTAALLAASALHFVAIGVWYLSMGAGLADLLVQARLRRLPIAQAWAWHLAGLVLGYLSTEPAIEIVGANGALFSTAITLLVVPRVSLFFLLPALGLAHLYDVDERLEDLRAAAYSFREVSRSAATNPLEDSGRNQYEREYLGWSRFGQLQVWSFQGASLRRAENRAVLALVEREIRVVLYNYRLQYDVPEWEGTSIDPNPVVIADEKYGLRADLYPSFNTLVSMRMEGTKTNAGDESVVLIGTGGGRSLSLLQPLHKGILAVERDPAAARYFTEVAPEANGYSYLTGSFLNADGRFVLDTASRPIDVISLESSHYHPVHAMMPAASTDFLHTREAIATALSRLKPGGLLIAEFSGLATQDSHAYLPEQTRQAMLEAGAHVLIFNTGEGDASTLVGCVGDGCLLRWTGLIKQRPASRIFVPDKWQEKRGTHWKRANTRPLTDGHPFPVYLAMEKSDRARVVGVGGAVFCLALLALRAVAQRGRGLGWNASRWFFLLGIAHTTLQLHGFHAWRTYFGDSFKTLWWMIIGWLVVAAVASALSPRLLALFEDDERRLKFTTKLLAAHFIATWLLPFWLSWAWARALFGAIALVPGGVLLGIWMPLGLRTAPEDRVGAWLAADALGTLAGAALLYVIMLPFGVPAFALLPIAAYLLLAKYWRPVL